MFVRLLVSKSDNINASILYKLTEILVVQKKVYNFMNIYFIKLEKDGMCLTNFKYKIEREKHP